MKILVAVDGSEFTRKMVAYWAAHDEWLGKQHSYTLLTVVPQVPPRAAAVLDRELLQGYYADEGEAVFKTLREFLTRQGIAATYLSKTGRVAEVIAKTAIEGDFDLLMMGSHGHSQLGGLVMGSVATSVLASCKVPVLLVR
ncbi:nucleotide-binding universal stress UspA family protein [Sphaerotilus hippei]|uniref:Nucleotide-binding universal stress UspA family protein n=1 Tax=Sphaerotilus hippei TaxID=744406 RepID=A0A318H9B1_9BURK|nr:universal stress protein [Sphaerotilus hippei]PXW96677.1 nucleotide-binding universal stress UspA family protein [Sphaerotilus hippei]